MFKIDTNIPIPARRCKYPLDTLKVGDSFYIDDRNLRDTIYAQSKYRKVKVTIRNEGAGIRVWRIA